MTTAAVLSAVLTYGPSIIPLIQKLVADIEAAKTAGTEATVTAADLAELAKLAGQTSASIYAREGVAPPPVTAS